ncbi:MAG: APC family permease [Mycoplasmatales bacterium]
MKTKITRNQALLTAIGFMIGSGIFFKADNIVASTGGNIVVSLFSWLFAATTLIFAGISVAAIASQKEIAGGFVGYIEHYFSKLFGEKKGKTLAFIIGWYQIVLYIPIMVAVVSRTFADFFFQFIGVEANDSQIFWAALIIMTFMFVWNGISTKIGALISSTATVIKVIPLILIALIGVIMGDWSNITSSVNPGIEGVNLDASTITLFLAPLMALSFAFDGWVSVGSLSKDIENPKKNLPFVFVASIIVTAIIYILYYLGINLLMPGDQIVALGDGHVAQIANDTIGPLFSKFIIFAVMFSVLGTANAIFMAGSRYVHKLASSDLLIGSPFFRKETENKTVFNASIFVFIVCIIFDILYSLQASLGVTSFNIDDIPMAINAFFYLFLFYITIALFKEKKLTTFKGVVAPAIAIFGQVAVIIAFMATVPGAFIFVIVSVIVVALGFINTMYKDFSLKNK